MTTTTAFIVLCGAILVNGAFLKRPDLNGRIIGGTDADIADLPYQLSLRSDKYELCSAAILSKHWVLTTAYCAYNASTVSMLFRAGSTLLNSGGSLHQAKEVIVHENFVDYYKDYDFALVRVDPPFTFGENVQPIALAYNEPAGGENAVISGWGIDSHSNDPFHERLQVANIPIFDHDKCNFYLNDYGGITERMICAGLLEGGKDACWGDFGAPLVVGGKLAGIASWGPSCGEPDYPTVYSNVANQLYWIKAKTGV